MQSHAWFGWRRAGGQYCCQGWGQEGVRHELGVGLFTEPQRTLGRLLFWLRVRRILSRGFDLCFYRITLSRMENGFRGQRRKGSQLGGCYDKLKGKAVAWTSEGAVEVRRSDREAGRSSRAHVRNQCHNWWLKDKLTKARKQSQARRDRNPESTKINTTWSLQTDKKGLLRSSPISLYTLHLKCSGSDGRVCLQCGRPRFDPWVRKIPWRRKGQLTIVFLPRKSHGRRSLVGYTPWGCKELDMTEWLTHTHKHY